MMIWGGGGEGEGEGEEEGQAGRDGIMSKRKDGCERD